VRTCKRATIKAGGWYYCIGKQNTVVSSQEEIISLLRDHKKQVVERDKPLEKVSVLERKLGN